MIEKILQLYEMLRVRHGVMVVGHPLAGKSVALNTLARALTAIAEKANAAGRKTSEGYPITINSINPKSITMDELYGSLDPLTKEWTNGVLATVFRNCAHDRSGKTVSATFIPIIKQH